MKPENTLRNNIHKKLPKELHHEKMANPWRGGTADDWYSGSKADMWIEWKWATTMPIKAKLVPDCSPLQLRWLNGRHAEGRNVRVVVGTPYGCVLFNTPKEWTQGISALNARAKVMTKQDVADWITKQTMIGTKCK